MKLGFKELGIQPSCPKCGEPYNTTSDFKIDSYDIGASKHLHVCDEKKVKQQKQELKEVVKDVNKKQAEILKQKDIDWNSDNMKRPMDI